MTRLILAAILVVVVLATVFRVRRAKAILRTGRDLILLYALAAVTLAVIYTVREGF